MSQNAAAAAQVFAPVSASARLLAADAVPLGTDHGGADASQKINLGLREAASSEKTSQTQIRTSQPSVTCM